MNVVYSVPHTGTRFTMAFLDYVGVSYIQKHAGEDISEFSKAVVPLRDPAVQFLSLRKRSECADFRWLLDESVRSWEQLTDGLKDIDHIFIKVDGLVDFENPKYSPLVKVANYFGAERNPAGFGWPVVHPYKFPPTRIASLNSVSEDERRTILDALKEHRTHYGYG